MQRWAIKPAAGLQLQLRPRRLWFAYPGGPVGRSTASSSSSCSAGAGATSAETAGGPRPPPKKLSARTVRRSLAVAARRGAANVPRSTAQASPITATSSTHSASPGSGSASAASSGGDGGESPSPKQPPKDSVGKDKAAPESSEQNWTTGHQHAQRLLSHLEGLTRTHRSLEISTRVLGIGGVVMACGAGYLIINWGVVRSEMSRESAEVISETIRDERLQFTAREFSKELLNQLLNDEEIANSVAKWVMTLLVKIQEDIGALFVRILHQEQVVQAVNHLADRLVAYLCSNRTIQEQVGQLLVDAICLQSSRDASAQWAYELVMREDVTFGFRDLVVAALQMDAVVSEAQTLAVGVLNRILQDPETISETRRLLGDTLRDTELRATAKESLWNIVMPWGSSKAPANDVKKTLKSLDELMVLESLTPEEKQMLKAIQFRLKNGGSASGPKVAGPSASEVTVATTSSANVELTSREDAERLAKDAALRTEEAFRAEEEARREKEAAILAEEEARRKVAAEAEREAREEAERREKEAALQAEEEARQKAAAEVERKAREETERQVQEAALRAEEETRQKAAAEVERKAREEAERQVQEAAIQAEEGRRRAAAEAEILASEQSQRQQEEAELKAVAEASERKAKEQIELKQKEEAEQKTLEESEQ